MSLTDLFKMSIKNLKIKWAALAILGIAISTFCFCFAGSVYVKVGQEKSLPFELIATTENSKSITDTTVVEITKIANVEKVSPVLQIPIQMKPGEYTAQLTLTGINPSYLDSTPKLPENDVMPYIILNENACKLFVKKNDESQDTVDMATNAPKIDWLNTRTVIQTDEESSAVTSKICGILKSSEEEEPSAYISLNAAKNLLRRSGQPVVVTTAYACIKNIGCAESVAKDIEALGLSVANENTELQKEWDSESKEMGYLTFVGVFCLFCTGVLLFTGKKLSLLEQKDAYVMLHWLGMRQKNIAKIFTLQSVVLSLMGIGIGVLVSIALPFFFSQESGDVSVFVNYLS